MHTRLSLQRRGFISGAALAGASAGLGAIFSPGKVEAQSGGQWTDVTAFGARGDGQNYDWPAINSAIGAISSRGGGVLYFPPGQYFLGDSSKKYPAKEVQLYANGTTVLAWGAEFFANANTDNGGLVTVVDRANPAHIVQNVSIFGGLFTPGDPKCNGLCLAQGRHILFHGCRVNNANGQQAICLQVDRIQLSGTPPAISFVRIVDCESFGGGTSGLEVRSAGADGLIQDILVDGLQIADVGPSNTAVVCSADSGHSMYRLNLSNMSISKTSSTGSYPGTGIYLNGLRQSILTNISMAVSHRGIDTHRLSECHLDNLLIVGQGQSTSDCGVVVQEAPNGCPLSVSNFTLDGFAKGICNFHANDATYGPGTIRNCAEGVNTTGPNQRSIYSGIQFDSCQTAVNAYQAGDKYFKLVNRSENQATLLRDDIS